MPSRHTDLETPADILKLLGHPIRLAITLLLLSGPKTVSFIETHLGFKQPNLSQHLAILRDAKIVRSSRRAKSVTYEIGAGLPQRILLALSAALANEPAPPEYETQIPAHTDTPQARPTPAKHLDDQEALVFATVRYPDHK